MGTQGIPIRIRRTSKDTPNNPYLGEPYLHMGDFKFGVYSGTNMLWYPGIDPINGNMILNQGQVLTGQDSAGNSTVGLSFDEPGKLRVIDMATNAQIAEFGQDSSTFANLTNTTMGAGGYFDIMNHPGFIPLMFSSTVSDTAVTSRAWLGPMTMLWKKSGAVGDLQVGYEFLTGAGDLTHPSTDANTLKITCTNGACNGLGVRTWYYDTHSYSSNNRECVSYVTVWGTAGETMSIRLGRNGSYSTTTVTGTGSWQRVSVSNPNILTSSILTYDLISLDVCYNPSGGEWYVHEPKTYSAAVNPTETFQYTSMHTRIHQASLNYWTPHYFPMLDGEPYYVTIPNQPFYYNSSDTLYAHYDVDILEADNPCTISNKSTTGFTITPTGTPSGTWKVKIRYAARGGAIDIV